MRLEHQCTKCGAVNTVPSKRENGANYVCHACGGHLRPVPPGRGDISAAVGMMGGAYLGAAVGGPAGAIVGGIIGFVLGKESKALG